MQVHIADPVIRARGLCQTLREAGQQPGNYTWHCRPTHASIAGARPAQHLRKQSDINYS